MGVNIFIVKSLFKNFNMENLVLNMENLSVKLEENETFETKLSALLSLHEKLKIEQNQKKVEVSKKFEELESQLENITEADALQAFETAANETTETLYNETVELQTKDCMNFQKLQNLREKVKEL